MAAPAPEAGPPPVGQIARGEMQWHAMPAGQAMERLGSSSEGLSEEEADRRLREWGANCLPDTKRRGPLRRLADQVNSVLIHVLLAAALLSFLFGHKVDALVILAVVILNTVIGFIQEGRAEQALEAIRAMVSPTAAVRRSGLRQLIDAGDVVPGDLVLLQPGDRVPADLRLIGAHGLRAEEAVLTGESAAVSKNAGPAAPTAPLAERHSMLFSGTIVSAGTAEGLVVATGTATELGRISSMVGEVEQLQTPLIAQMGHFARRLTAIILAACVAAFLFAAFIREYALPDAFMIVVGLAVSAIPEGMPAIMTITLAIGVRRMAVRNAIIRRLPAVETLGSVSVICTDKTGTLTRNEMTVVSLVTPSGEQSVSGTGYSPEGAVEDAGSAQDLIRAGAIANDAAVLLDRENWRPDGDSMEAALITLAMKAGIDLEQLRTANPRIDEIPFAPEQRFMATLNGDEAPVAFIKGAPERILAMCGSQQGESGDQPIDTASWTAAADRLAKRGQRVLAFAMKPLHGARRLDAADLQQDLVLLGIAGFIDPPRNEARQAVRDCRTAGIGIIMITGDHAVTAAEIARQLDLAPDPRVMTGSELEDLEDDQLREAVRKTTVFARTTPEHKIRLVSALQSLGLTVAMTGDGVNDAPALKRADVGVAMGRKGTEASKQAAEIVLADDNFASIAAAVREGRTVYDNLRKMIAWTLPTNGGESFTILVALALGLTLPITPVQILWVNMVTAVALGLTFAFEPPEPGVMQRPPRPRGEQLLNRQILWRIGFVSALMVAGSFAIYAWAMSRELTLEAARTLVVNAIVAMEIFYLFSVRFVHGTSLTAAGVLGTPSVITGLAVTVAAQTAFTYWPPANAVFGTAPVDLLSVLLVIGTGALLLLIVETEKWFGRMLANGPGQP